MAKTKSRGKKSRSQKGGDMNSWFSGFSNYFSGFGSKAKAGLNSVEQGLGSATNSATNMFNNATQSASKMLSTDVNLTTNNNATTNATANTTTNAATTTTNNTMYNTPVQPGVQPPITSGGRRTKTLKRKTRKMRGGARGLGLTYYATPVSGLKVAEPTYLITSKGYIKTGGRTNKRRRTRK
jgi:hypothetical protein